jgi:flagella basal body P-ring formation protein FlgA
MIIPALAFAVISTHACQAVDSDRITGRDLAAANSIFASTPADLDIGATPVPGVQRILRSDEVARIAHAGNIATPTPAPELCFERATSLLTADRLLPELEKALALDSAKIEILDFIHAPVPPGTLEFTRAGLQSNGIWRGRLVYSEGRAVQIWAKVRVTTTQTWIETATPIEAGKPISPDQLIVRTGERFPFGAAPVDSIEFLTARKAARFIRAGEPIFASMLTAPHDVERGETVTVRVTAGETELTFDAVAESSGRAGESVLIRNPDNGRFFQARIESKGKVVVSK